MVRRDRANTVVLDADDFAAIHVDEGDDALDRTCIAVVRGTRAEIGESAADAAAIVAGRDKVAGGPGIDLDKFEVGEDYGWNDLVDDLEIIEIPGNHISVFHAENIDAIAAAFRGALDAVVSRTVV